MKREVCNVLTNVKNAVDKKVIACSLAVGSVVGSALPVFAEEAGSGTSTLDATVTSAISSGAQDLLATVTNVIGITIPVTITAIGIVVGAKFALKQIKGVMSKAS